MQNATTEGRPPGGQRGHRPISQADPLLSLPAGRLWRSTLPAPARRLWRTDRGAATARWAEILSGRWALPDDFHRAGALAFGWDAADPAARAARRLTSPKTKDRVGLVRLAHQALKEAENAENSPAGALRLLSLAHAAPRLAAVLPPDDWWSMTCRIYRAICGAHAAGPTADADAETLLAHQLVAGEAGLALAVGLAELRPVRALRKPAAATLSEGLLALTDGEGMPPARCLPHAAALLACWTRCAVIAERAGKRCFDAAASTQYEWLVRQMLRLARPDGSLMLTGSAAPTPLWVAAVALGGDAADLAAAGKRLRIRVPRGDQGHAPPLPSVNSEWSGLAVLASGWKRKAARLAVAWEDEGLGFEVGAGQTVLAGEWPIEAEIDGAPVAVVGGWEQQCWFSDDQSDYLELGIELADGARLERLFFLAHDLEVAMVAQVLLTRGSQPKRIALDSRLPLGPAVAFLPEKETREGWLMSGDKRLAGATPVGLAEWRVEPRGGELMQQGPVLSLAQTAQARNLLSPLVLDFKPARFAKQRTWRRLTVAEQLERVPADVAVGYRYQSGRDQLVAYRSLAAPGNRTFLGQNYASEAVIGRFHSTGQSRGWLEEYLEIDSTTV